MSQDTYPDIQIREGDSISSYGREGHKCKRIFKIDFADNSVPTSTLYSILTAGSWTPADPYTEVPIRGTPHPSIIIESAWGAYMLDAGAFEVNNCFCADVITVKGLTSTQAVVEVEYAIFTAMNQEPSEYCDAAPALVQIGSSVQAAKVALDNQGNPLVVPYLAAGPTTGDYKISPSGSSEGPFTPSPSIKITADKLFPGSLIRFLRRERKARSPKDVVGYVHVNDDSMSPWTIDINPSFVPEDQTLICSRIENATEDNGQSYLVTYEFTYAELIDYPADSNFSGEAVAIDGKISQWQLNAYYTLQQGIGVDSSNVLAFGVHATPPDAVPTIFQMYNTFDMNVSLNLSA